MNRPFVGQVQISKYEREIHHSRPLWLAAQETPLTSAVGYKQTSSRPKSKSALPPETDLQVGVAEGQFVTLSDVVSEFRHGLVGVN